MIAAIYSSITLFSALMSHMQTGISKEVSAQPSQMAMVSFFRLNNGRNACRHNFSRATSTSFIMVIPTTLFPMLTYTRVTYYRRRCPARTVDQYTFQGFHKSSGYWKPASGWGPHRSGRAGRPGSLNALNIYSVRTDALAIYHMKGIALNASVSDYLKALSRDNGSPGGDCQILGSLWGHMTCLCIKKSLHRDFRLDCY